MGKSTIRLGSETEMGTELSDDLDDLDYKPPNSVPGSGADMRDMIRMGKRQEFSRNFAFLSIVAYSVVAVSTWQGQLGTQLNTSVPPGTPQGLANVVWTFVVLFVLWCAIVASLAEMASMAPTSAGQYHWVSEFAPPYLSRALSYMTGWCCILAWQSNFVQFCSNIPQDIQSLALLTGKKITFQNWHESLAIIAMATIAFIFNATARHSLPLAGGVLVILFVCCFLAVLVTLWVLGPRADAKEVFLSFADRGNPHGVASAIAFGTFRPMLTLMSPDVAVHMAEEIKDASRVLPSAMMTSILINGLLGFLMLVTSCFTIGDPDTLISSGITAHLYILFNSTHSVAVTLSIQVMLDIIELASVSCALTSASRQLFAFARDGGVPFSSFVAYVRPGWNLPLNAMFVCYGFCIIVSIINVGWHQIMGICVVATVSGNLLSYLISITCLRLKRWRNEPLPPRRWSLGRWGGPINDVAILALSFLLLMYYLPNGQYAVVTPQNFNFNIVASGGILILSAVLYYFQGQKIYRSPVNLIRRDD